MIPCYISKEYLLGLHHIYNLKGCELALLERFRLISCGNESQIWCLELDYWGCQDNPSNICKNINCRIFPGWFWNPPWLSSVSFFRWRKFCISAFQSAVSTVWLHFILISELWYFQALVEVMVGMIMIKIHVLLELSCAWQLLPDIIINHFLWRSQ